VGVDGLPIGDCDKIPGSELAAARRLQLMTWSTSAALLAEL